MGRYTFPAFNKSLTPRYVVVWDLQWALIERRLNMDSCSYAMATIGAY